MGYFDECPFCTTEDVDWRVINDERLVVSFLSKPRLSKGHALVIPGRHVEEPGQLSDSENVAIAHEIARLRTKMLGKIAAGVDVFQKSRPHVEQGFNGTKVDHLHYHVLPSNPGNELYDKGIIWTPDRFSPLTQAEADEVIPLLQGGHYYD